MKLELTKKQIAFLQYKAILDAKIKKEAEDAKKEKN